MCYSLLFPGLPEEWVGRDAVSRCLSKDPRILSGQDWDPAHCGQGPRAHCPSPHFPPSNPNSRVPGPPSQEQGLDVWRRPAPKCHRGVSCSCFRRHSSSCQEILRQGPHWWLWEQDVWCQNHSSHTNFGASTGETICPWVWGTYAELFLLATSLFQAELRSRVPNCYNFFVFVSKSRIVVRA